MVDWHRREANPGWWEYFRLGKQTGEQLADESGPIGNLSSFESTEAPDGHPAHPRLVSAAGLLAQTGDKVYCPVTESPLA